ncbi:unnamed protein product [Ectocarpus sp. CCAP 1310/34]|nr:unnamed protein product [Ectocarpus sp. CCAP 1310/34]
MSNVRQRKLRVESSDDEDEASPRGKSAGGTFSSATTARNTQTNVAVAESRLRKVIVRSVVGFFMVTSFVGIVWAGHLYLCALVVLIQACVFKEMVSVRYSAAKERDMPLFRTLQWSWFVVAIFYTYGDFLHEFVLKHRALLWLSHITMFNAWLSFIAYCCVFVVSVLTLKKGLYKYQVGQLTWTIVTICMIVAQVKFVAHNIFNGIFWFFFPASLVICNDITAYFCGITAGRKLIRKPFLKISPNKTWEGFIGAFFFTCLFAFYFSAFLAKFEWFTCPVQDLNFRPKPIHCNPDAVFLPAEFVMPESVRWFMEAFLFFRLPVASLSVTLAPIQLHALLMAGFTSVIAPFGGYWASAIKRAYGIKDFDSIIPGHGGVTDRMDCQFITALFVSVHYNTFIRPNITTVEGLLAAATMLSHSEQLELLDELKQMMNST